VKGSSGPAALACTLILLLVSLSLGQVLCSTFLWDDASIILENPSIRHFGRLLHVFSPTYWERFHGLAYRPLAHATYFVDYALWDNTPAGYHLSNLLIHTAAALLIFAVARLATGSRCGALFAALVFAVHPVHVESIAFVKNRSEMLATCAVLASVWLLAGGGRRSLVGAPVCYGLSLLAKESVVLVPFALLPGFLAPCGRRSGLGKRCAMAAMYLISLLYVCVRVLAVGGTVGREGGAFPVPLRALAAAKTVVAYAELGIMPRGLCVDRAFDLPAGFGDGGAWLSVAALGAVLGICIWRFRRRPVAATCVLWFVAALLPSANLIPMPWRPLAEQRMYAASAGLCLLVVVWGIGVRRIRVRAALFVFITLCLAALSLARVSVLRNDESMWRDAIRKSSRRPQPHLAFGNALLRQGCLARAMSEYEKTLKADPKYWWAHCGIARIYEARGDLRRAEAEYQRAHAIDPRAYRPLLGLAQLAERRREYRRAASIYKRILGQYPRLAKVWGKLGLALWHSGQRIEAKKALEKALEVEPDMQDARECMERLFGVESENET